MSSSSVKNPEHLANCRRHGEWNKNGTLNAARWGLVITPIVLASLVFLGTIYGDYSVSARAPAVEPFHAAAMTVWLSSVIFACVSFNTLICQRDKCLQYNKSFDSWTTLFTASTFYLLVVFVLGVALAFWHFLGAAILGIAALVLVAVRIGFGYSSFNNGCVLVLFYVSVLNVIAITGYCLYIVQYL